MNKYILIIILCFNLNAFSTEFPKTKSSPKIQHQLYLGIGTSNYFFSRASSVYGQLKKTFDNTYPSYRFGYEALAKVKNQFYIGLGISYYTSKTSIVYTNFATPNVMNGVISLPLKHNFISMPLNFYWKVPVSSISSLYLTIGAESFKTTKFAQYKNEFVSIYKPDGASIDNNYNISTKYNIESMSLFRIMNLGMKLSLNENEKNRIALGLNYYLMRNGFPIESKANLYVGNKNFIANNSIYFEGVNLSVGYIW